MTVYASRGQDACLRWCGGQRSWRQFDYHNRALWTQLRSAFGLSAYNPSSHCKLGTDPSRGNVALHSHGCLNLSTQSALHSFYWAQIYLCHPIRSPMQLCGGEGIPLTCIPSLKMNALLFSRISRYRLERALTRAHP